MNPAIRRRQFGLGGLLAVILSFTVGCADLNDDPPPANSGSGELTVSLTALAQQLGYRTDQETGLHTTPTVSAATTPVVTLVIGGMVVRSRTLAQGPYSDSVPITDLKTQLEVDLLSSVNSLQLVQLPLPAGQNTVSVSIPGPGTEKWQFLAAGFRAAADGTRPQTLADLGDDKFQDAAIYFAFHPQFLKTSVSGQTVTILDAVTGAVVPETAITLTLKRACLVDFPPNGCAQYDNDPDRTPRVTAAVEIIGIYLNNSDPGNIVTSGGDNLLSSAIIVRDSGSTTDCLTGSCTKEAAIAHLTTNFGTTVLAASTTKITVKTTHTQSANESSTCRGVAVDSTTIAELVSNCEIQSYITTY